MGSPRIYPFVHSSCIQKTHELASWARPEGRTLSGPAGSSQVKEAGKQVTKRTIMQRSHSEAMIYYLLGQRNHLERSDG